MMAKGFKPVGWVAAVGGAALGCYMLSLNVAAERAELGRLEHRILVAKQDIRSLQTELGTRGRLSQLEQWNAEILALSAPNSAQHLEEAVMLARFDQRQPTVSEKIPVHLASAEIAAKPAPKVAPGDFAAAARARAAEPAPLVRHASLPTADTKALVRKASLDLPLAEPASAPAPRKPVPAAKSSGGLLDTKVLADIGAAAKAETRKSGAAAAR